MPQIVNDTLKALPIPKPMRWGERESAFVRPAHWLVMLLGDKVVDGEVLGLKRPHEPRPPLHGPGKPVWIATASGYVDALRAAHVIVDPVERRALIERVVQSTAADLGGSGAHGPSCWTK